MSLMARRNAEKQYKAVLGELTQIYADAQRDLRMKVSSWEHAHRKRVAIHKRELEAGEITKADFEAWMQGQVFQRQAWQKKQEQLARLMVDADKEAIRVVNSGKIEVFAESANLVGYGLEQGVGADFGFAVYNQDSVRRLIREKPQMLPMARIKEGRDYAWYNEIMRNSINQGILQGEDLEDIMLRVINETCEKSLGSVRRNARTAYNSAMNAGVVEGMKQAQRLGIKVKKRWNCSFLPGTREAHALLNGVTIDVDQPFDSELGPIMQPGDMSAEPANVWNCHCWIEEIFEKYPGEDRTKEDAMKYADWKAMKAGR